MSHTLVVGCGFIGSHVVAQLAAAGRPPSVLTRSRPADPEIAAIAEPRLHLGDAGDRATLERALEGVDHVAFCAGGLLPVDSERDPELDRKLTLNPVRTVLAALRERPGVTLTYLSSGGTVYGDPERLPAREDDPTAPISAYGKLHLACELEIERDRREHGLDSTILRCSTVYGEHQSPGRGQGAIVTFLDRIERGETIDLFGGGSTIRDYVYAGDVAGALIALLGRSDAPVVNVGSGTGTSLLEVLRLAERQVGREAEIAQHDERGFDVHQIVLDTTRLHEMVDLEMTPLDAGIARTHRWLVSGRGEGS
ncbi:MAG TPA: NAD-dependent epimerase/dehydratase family protein [Solirubrobacterales bacterium]|nr:NAD-dependent epimerase/dehydratase family protein [Solirubrobacterales bacterium]